MIICLYVDDMLIIRKNMELINNTKLLFFFITFEMKDLGEADVILGVKIQKIENGLFLCQSHYIEKILQKFDRFDVPPGRTLYDSSKNLMKNTDYS